MIVSEKGLLQVFLTQIGKQEVEFEYDKQGHKVSYEVEYICRWYYNRRVDNQCHKYRRNDLKQPREKCNVRMLELPPVIDFIFHHFQSISNLIVHYELQKYTSEELTET